MISYLRRERANLMSGICLAQLPHTVSEAPKRRTYQTKKSWSRTVKRYWTTMPSSCPFSRSCAPMMAGDMVAHASGLQQHQIEECFLRGNKNPPDLFLIEAPMIPQSWKRIIRSNILWSGKNIIYRSGQIPLRLWFTSYVGMGLGRKRHLYRLCDKSPRC